MVNAGFIGVGEGIHGGGTKNGMLNVGSRTQGKCLSAFTFPKGGERGCT